MSVSMTTTAASAAYEPSHSSAVINSVPFTTTITWGTTWVGPDNPILQPTSVPYVQPTTFDPYVQYPVWGRPQRQLSPEEVEQLMEQIRSFMEKPEAPPEPLADGPRQIRFREDE